MSNVTATAYFSKIEKIFLCTKKTKWLNLPWSSHGPKLFQSICFKFNVFPLISKSVDWKIECFSKNTEFQNVIFIFDFGC